MIAPDFAGVEEQMWIWLFAMIRPGAMMMAAPIFSATSIPIQLRLILSLAIGMAGVSSGTLDLPIDNIISLEGFLFVAGEILVGVAIGFALQIGYSASFVAGEVISNAMGLGFAMMIDPQTGRSTPVLGNFLSIVATLLLLAMDGHLMLIAILVNSYTILPPGDAFMSAASIHGLVNFGGTLFAMGLVIALPVGSAIILVQVIMAMLARSAPSLNLFAVGLPVALLGGLLLLAISAPIMANGIMHALQDGLGRSALIAGGQ